MSIFRRMANIARAEVNARLRGGVGNSRKRGTRVEDDPLVDEDFDAYAGAGSHTGSGGSTGAHTSRGGGKIEGWYAALELPPGSDFKAVQKAWRDMLRRYHPDKHAGDPEKARVAHEVSQQINEAYNGLKKHLGG